MGADVFGRAPRSKTGQYFCRNIWGWWELARLCNQIAPEICSGCKYWHGNDGDGLNDADASALAESLERLVKNHREVLIADALMGDKPSEDHEFSTNVFDDHQAFVRNVTEFAAFLRDCGGFSIE
jgi:hypothetical protein